MITRNGEMGHSPGATDGCHRCRGYGYYGPLVLFWTLREGEFVDRVLDRSASCRRRPARRPER